jgi:transposase
MSSFCKIEMSSLYYLRGDINMRREELIAMNNKEILRLQVIEKVETKRLRQNEAGKFLQISCRQVRRLLKSYRRQGAKGLVSKKRGMPSNNKICDEVKQRILAITKEKYVDFGPTFLREKLLENHNINVSRETLRKWLIAENIRSAKCRPKVRIHQLRERRNCFGELIQIDGSPHDWFEGRGDKCCLLVFIDDATGKIVHLRFEKTETTEGYFRAMLGYIKQHGLPIALYSDKHGIFRVNMPQTTHEGETQFKRAMDNLGVKTIYANSPQAKGRVERANKTLQDRLVKELRLAGVSDIETANKFLPNFIEEYNKKFAVEPKSKANAHRQLNLSDEELNLIFSIQTIRTVSRNLELSYNDTVYQIQVAGHGYTLRHAKILVCKDLSGAVNLIYKNKKLEYKFYRKQKRNGAIVDTKRLNQIMNEFIKNPVWEKYTVALLRSATTIATPAIVSTG